MTRGDLARLVAEASDRQERGRRDLEQLQQRFGGIRQAVERLGTRPGLGELLAFLGEIKKMIEVTR